MNPFMNTNEASNNLHRKEQDATHKAAIGKLTEMVRAAQQSTLTELQAENAALKEQVEFHKGYAEEYKESLAEVLDDRNKLKERVAQLESDNKMLCESFSTASVNMKKTITTLRAKDAALEQALDQWLLSTVNDRVKYSGERAITRADLESTVEEQAAELAKRQDQIVIDERVIAEKAETLKDHGEIQAELCKKLAEHAKELTDLRLQCITDFGQYQEAHEKIAEQAKEIEGITREKGIEHDTANAHMWKADELRQQLQASQAREAQMREALEYHQQQTRPIDKTIAALAIPSDDSALREYGAKLVEKFFWATGGNGVTKYMEIQDKIREGAF